MDNNVTLSPLIDFFESLGFSRNGGNTIKYFSTKEDEVNSLYCGVGLRDISMEGIIELKGKDVLDFIHRISTNSTKNLPKEQITKTIFTTEKGRIIDLTILFNFEDYQLLFCNAENLKKVKSWINRYVISDDVKAQIVDGKYTMLELLGPQAESFASLICGKIVNEIAPDSFKVVSSEGLLFFLAKISSGNGKFKYWFIADKENGQNLVQFMLDNKGPFDFNLIGEAAYKEYRIEQGIPKAPNELNDNFNPHDANLIQYVDFKKGCYIGQEVIARLDTYEKIKHTLTGICFNENADESASYTLYDKEGKEAGAVTSLVNSIKCKKYIGLAYVKKSLYTEGKELIARDENGKEIPVNIHHLPFKK